MKKIWAVAIAQADDGRVYLQLNRTQKNNDDCLDLLYSGRVPLWDGLPPTLLENTITEWAARLTVNHRGRQIGRKAGA